MRPRDVLAANFKKLLDGVPGLGRLPQVTKASGGTLTNGTLDRIRRAEAQTGVDQVGELAKVYGLQAWQLLIPSLRVVNGKADGSTPIATELITLIHDLEALPEEARNNLVSLFGKMIAAEQATSQQGRTKPAEVPQNARGRKTG